MMNDWGAMTRDYSTGLRDARAGIPDVMKGFPATAQAALKANALDTKTKELLALGIAVATRASPSMRKLPSNTAHRGRRFAKPLALRSIWVPVRA